MRICALLLLAAGVGVAADVVVSTGGGVLSGRVVEVVLETGQGKVRLPRDRIASVRMELDRALLDSSWLASNLRFALERARRGVEEQGGIGVFFGRGVSAPSAQAVVRRLEEKGVVPRLFFSGDVTRRRLAGLKAVVFPGGWAPSQNAALGPEGRRALQEFVQGGGGYLGICAGSYLACTTVVWEKRSYAYEIGLLAGQALGPVPGLAAWPQSQGVEVSSSKGRRKALYAGGCSFAVKGARVLARYKDGRPAVVKKGRIVLTGVHPEFTGKDKDLLAGWADRVDPGDGSLFHELLALLR